MKDWKPSVSDKALQIRARLNAQLRKFFADRGVMEVETPILSSAGNTDANIESFHLEFSGVESAGPARRWLRTSPEFALKRLLAAGVGNCYELGRVFRNGEMGRIHNPEFTMLEWYRIGWTHHQLMDECAELVKDALRLAGRSASIRESSFRQLYHDNLGLDPLTASEAELRAPLAVFDISSDGLTRDDWLDLLMTHMIQPSIPANRILMVYDYPKSQAALARVRQGDVPVAERFEIYTATLQKRLPRFRLPLATDDRDTVLNLHTAFTRCYDQGGFAERIDYQKDPQTRLEEEDRLWLGELLAQRRSG